MTNRKASFSDIDGKDAATILVTQTEAHLGFSVALSGKDYNFGPVPATFKLPMAEALQFAADTLSAEIPGRLSPFQRGWNATATDFHTTGKKHGLCTSDSARAEKTAALNTMLDGLMRCIEDLKADENADLSMSLAKVIAACMILEKQYGWNIPERLNAFLKAVS